jgi:3-oxoacyl-[acyl-carrier protein] reductase
MPEQPRSALVTGATRGIGLGIVRMLAARGYALTLGARDAERLTAVADELRALGAPHVHACAGDLADPDWPAMAADAHREAYGGLDCLVLNAGVGTAGPIVDYPMSRLDKTLAVNLRSPFALLQGCLPLLRSAAEANPVSGARVVALSSMAGVYAEAGLAAYGATKAAVLSLVAALNAEESGRGVSGTALAPGYVATDMSEWIRDRIPAEQMIPVDDVVRIVEGLVDLTARTVVPQVIMGRAGAAGFVA